MYRLDVVLKNGKRHRAYYDPDFPGVVRISKLALRPDDGYLDGATYITSNDELLDMMRENGFNVIRPNADKVDYCVRLSADLAQVVANTAAATGSHEAAVIRRAVEYWIKSGCP